MSETQISKRKLSELTQATDFSVQKLANLPSEFKSKNKKGAQKRRLREYVYD